MSINDIFVSLTIATSMILLMISIAAIGIASITAIVPMFKIERNAKC